MITCVCMDYDSDSPAFDPTTEMRAARKEHRCCECGDTIKPGNRYEYVRGLWDGHWSTFRTCRVCAQIREDFMSCGWSYGSLWEDMHDAFCDGEDDDWLSDE